MNRELSMEFVRVTEAAAIACGRSVGRGDKTVPISWRSTLCARHSIR